MMKKLMVKGVILFLFAIWAPVSQFAGNCFTGDPAFSVSAASHCPQEPPSNFHVSSYTNTSITMKWTENTPGLYYWITCHDNTTNTAMGMVVVQGDEYTWATLPSAHSFSFTAAASSCMEGPPGAVANADGKTGIIIVDEIVNFNACEPPFTPGSPGSPSIKISIAASQNAQGIYEPAYTARFNYLGIPYKFALVFDENNQKVYLEECPDGDPNNRFYVNTSSNNDIGSIFFGSQEFQQYAVEVVRIDQLSVDNPAMAIVSMRISYIQPITNFGHCNNVGTGGGISLLNSTNTGQSNIAAQPFDSKSGVSSGVRNTTDRPSPNPFTEYATLRYTLDSDGPVNIRLFDPMGRLVQTVENTTQQSAGTYEATVNGEGLPGSVYYLHLQTNGDTKVFPIVKRQ